MVNAGCGRVAAIQPDLAGGESGGRGGRAHEHIAEQRCQDGQSGRTGQKPRENDAEFVGSAQQRRVKGACVRGGWVDGGRTHDTLCFNS